MFQLHNVVQPYAWGSRSFIASLSGLPPSESPQAELWMGDHPLGASQVTVRGETMALGDAIRADPDGMVGPGVRQTYGPRLPFLVKVLAAAEPLSLQAHPNQCQAEDGFDSEQRQSIPMDSPSRSYKDRSHKPELLCALTPFDALCGFRDVQSTARYWELLEVPALRVWARMLLSLTPREALRQVIGQIWSLHASERRPVVQDTLQACNRHMERGERWRPECAWVLRLGDKYPGDAGVLVAMMLNLVRLRPGEAVFLPSGSLHAYLQGAGIEVMANSDNVLRGGLTAKHVDTAELLRVLSFEQAAAPIILPTQPFPWEQVWPAPASEFRLSRLTITEAVQPELTMDGPEVLLCVEGSAVLTAKAGDALSMTKGQSCFLAASDQRVTLRGNGVMFRTRVAPTQADSVR